MNMLHYDSMGLLYSVFGSHVGGCYCTQFICRTLLAEINVLHLGASILHKVTQYIYRLACFTSGHMTFRPAGLSEGSANP